MTTASTRSRIAARAVLPNTPMVHTASGGLHLYFKLPSAGLRNTVGERGRGIGPGLDWRGLGGYVIVPAKGTGYDWVRGGKPAPVPAALMPKAVPTGNGAAVGEFQVCTELYPYGEAALRSAF